MNTKREQLYKMFFGSQELSLADYLFNSSSDEIVEIDLYHDTFKQIYHTDGKYFIPTLESSFLNLFDFALQGIVHPDDIDKFNNLMNPRTLLDRLHNNKETPNFLMDQFRYRLQNGQWRWVEQCVLTGEENGIEEGKVVVFMRDIESLKLREKGQFNTVENFLMDAGKDELTRLYRSEYFIGKADEIIKKDLSKPWCLLLIDIENFRLFDEWYGKKEGDMLLASIGNYILNFEEKYNSLGGYFGQDDFAILLEYNRNLIDEIYEDIRRLTIRYGHSDGFAPAIGVYIFEPDVTIKEAFDYATIAASKAKKDVDNRIIIFDSKSKNQLEIEHKILSDVMEAVRDDLITFVLQPQCRLSSKKIVGAESLARWIKKDGTVVPPAQFIPILEKYGFISDLDKILWEKVFKWIRGLLDKGIKPVPISLNVSRADVFAIDIADYFLKLANKYDVPSKYIKIEITESSYAEETGKVNDAVQKLRNNGFTVLMDDFGSGYSSLNALRELRVDVIKLDALFLNFSGVDDEKAIHIIESVINMTRMISLPVIVEGVETKEQVDFLESLGCRYVQGFYFYRPLPIEEFEKLISDEEVCDYRGIIFKHNEQFRIREFLDKNVYSDNMLNNILGAVAVYAWEGENVDIVRFNEQFYKSVNVPDFENRIEHIQNWMPDLDKEALFKSLEDATKDKLNGSVGSMRFATADGRLLSFIIHFFYLGERDGSKRFYGSATNVTDLADLKDEIHLFSDYSRDSLILLRKGENNWKYVVTSHALSDMLGISRKQLEEEMNNGKFYKRVVNKKEYEKFSENLHSFYEENQDFHFVAKLKDTKDCIIEVNFIFQNVTNKTNNIKYILYTDKAK